MLPHFLPFIICNCFGMSPLVHLRQAFFLLPHSRKCLCSVSPVFRGPAGDGRVRGPGKGKEGGLSGSPVAVPAPRPCPTPLPTSSTSGLPRLQPSHLWGRGRLSCLSIISLSQASFHAKQGGVFMDKKPSGRIQLSNLQKKLLCPQQQGHANGSGG